MTTVGVLEPRTAAGQSAARLVRIYGVVQGVGFRPFVHRLAMRFGLRGWVRNTSGEVEILIEGPVSRVDGFLQAVELEAPPLARIDDLSVQERPLEGLAGFEVTPSVVDPSARQPVSPDVATCARCETELFEPANRRYRYPFITCTDCGPRFTVIESMPYDRERTSMRVFPQCPDCLLEYRSPGDRRYHSETNSCPACGPHLWFESPAAGPDEDPITAAAAMLRDGGVVAIRGLGGFHLAVDATDEVAVRRLRERKHREAKPLAVMVRTLEDARRLVELPGPVIPMLTGPERPIVLLPVRPEAGIAPSVAPGLREVGLMLATTPIHHLLLDAAGRPLVMTSGNRSEEPIAIGNAEARTRLPDIADGFLLHDREIVARYDDSVLRPAGGAGTILLRRARGFAPLPIDLPVATPRPLVAVGPHLKNTFTLAEGRRAWPGQHVGDLENLETVEHFQAALDRFRRLFRIEPEVAVRDLHPGYLSSRLAEELCLDQVLAVQHHHAHIAAVLAEHGRAGPVLGLALDGTGYGTDGLTWGAELLWADLTGFDRLAHLRYAPMPGGDLAARTPWRAALGYLSLEPGLLEELVPFRSEVPQAELNTALQQVERGLNAPLASSVGRLFDAAAALLGVRLVASFEGQAAMELEAVAGTRPAREFPTEVRTAAAGWIWDPVPLLVELAHRKRRGDRVDRLAARFHESVAAAVTRLVLLGRSAIPARRSGARPPVALAGGCFQNARLLESVARRLTAVGLEVLRPTRLSPNDGAVSVGQAAVAAALLSART